MHPQRPSSNTSDEPHQSNGAEPSRARGLSLLFFIMLVVVLTISTIAPSCAAAANEKAACDGSTIVRYLRLVDESRATDRATIEIARAQVESIWATAGIRVVWVASGGPGAMPRPDAYVILRKDSGNAIKDAALIRSGWFKQLGWVRFNSEGERSHLIEVSLANIRLSLLYAEYDNGKLAHRPRPIQIVAMGRALGRIIAHEFGHWLLGRGHEADGLMKPELRHRELLNPEMPLLPRAWTNPADTSDSRMTRLRAMCGRADTTE